MSVHKKGADYIADFLKTLPSSPGVYRMLAEDTSVLYVGKAKNLKKRVTSYTVPEKQSIRIQRMIAQTVQMEFAVTHTEAEALLLEANLIKKLKPRYNILLRDDKSFPYILIRGDHDFPQVTKHRGAKDQKGEYFGPFASSTAVNESLGILHRAFLLRNCSDHVFTLRTRPCLQYQIKRCTAPCVGHVTQQQYAEQVDMARQFLSGKSRAIQDQFIKKMQHASEDQDYETAAFYRDRIRALTHIQQKQNVHLDGISSADIHALYQKDGNTCIQVFFFRAGQNFGNRAYFPRHEKDDTPENILSSFLAQFYLNKPAPKEIIVSHSPTDKTLIVSALRMQSPHAIRITAPTRGNKKELVGMALENAEKALLHKRAAEASHTDMLEKLAEHFNLDTVPERVEVYDKSHISGSHALGVMIVAGPEGFQKNSYRKFNMPKEIAGDDYAMMTAMLTRRFQALIKEQDDNTSRPDLLLIDGGQGQLTSVLKVMADLGISDIPVIAIAKGPDRNAGRERLFMDGQPPVQLEPNDPLLYFLQRIRDESHRFAITSHRAKRSKAILKNPLDDIPGIGSKRKKALLLHFGSAKAVAEAGISDLQKVEGISKSFAEKIYSFFHE